MDNLRATEMDSPLNRRVRAFLGLGPPPDEWLDALDEWLTPLKRRLHIHNDSLEGVKWINRENLHLTLRFFGNVTQKDVLQIEETVRESAKRFEKPILTVPHLAFFPHRTDPVVPRVNGEIRAETVRIVGEKGEQIGTLPLSEAMTLAGGLHSDLVEVAPHAIPPVCRITDLRKFRHKQLQAHKNSPLYIMDSRIAMLSLLDPADNLARIESSIREATSPFGQFPDKRDFHPHITIGRILHLSGWQWQILFEVWRDSRRIPMPEWEPREVTLFESKLQPGGSVYTPLAKFPFGSKLGS